MSDADSIQADAASAAAWDAAAGRHDWEDHEAWEMVVEGCIVCEQAQEEQSERWREYFDRKGWTREQLEEIQERIGSNVS